MAARERLLWNARTSEAAGSKNSLLPFSTDSSPLTLCIAVVIGIHITVSRHETVDSSYTRKGCNHVSSEKPTQI